MNLRVGLPAGTRIFARCGTYLISDLNPRSRAGAGLHRVLVSLDYLPIAEGVLPSPFCNFETKPPTKLRGMIRLWVLSTIVMVVIF